MMVRSSPDDWRRNMETTVGWSPYPSEEALLQQAHDKQGFEHTTVLSRLENRLVVIQKKYRSTNCQETGYAKRCKTSSDTKNKPSMDDENIVPTGINSNDARAKLIPIRKHEASNPEENEIYTSTSPNMKRKESDLLRESKVTMNGDGHVYNGDDTTAKLKEENLHLKKRLETSEGVMLNDLLMDLQSEKEKTVSLENQVVKLQEKIEVLDQEQINLISN